MCGMCTAAPPLKITTILTPPQMEYATSKNEFNLALFHLLVCDFRVENGILSDPLLEYAEPRSHGI